jgi:hypothetical protein
VSTQQVRASVARLPGGRARPPRLARQSAARLNLLGPACPVPPHPTRPGPAPGRPGPHPARRLWQVPAPPRPALKAAAGQCAAASGDASAGRSAAHTEAGPATGRPQRRGTPRSVLTHSVFIGLLQATKLPCPLVREVLPEQRLLRPSPFHPLRPAPPPRLR